MNRMLRGRAAGLIFSASAAGCSNQPGALRLELEPTAAVFRNDEPLRFKATLVADAPRVCVGSDHAFSLEVRGPMGEAARADIPAERAHHFRFGVVRCGGALVVVWPVLIVYPVAQLLDVGDLMGSYEIIRSGAAREICLVASVPPPDLDPQWYRAWHENLSALFDDASGVLSYPGRVPFPEPGRLPFPQPGRWKPGRYEVRVRFEHAHKLAPLFWQPYDHELSASTSIMIVEQPEDPARQAFLESVAP